MASANRHSKDDEVATTGRARPWLTVLTVLVLLLGMAITLERPTARWYIRRNLSAAERAKLDELQTKPVNFRKEWSEPEPIPPHIDAGIDEWLKVWSAQPPAGFPSIIQDPPLQAAFERAIRGAPLSADAQSSLSAEAAKALPLAIVTSKLANLPGWDRQYATATPLEHYGVGLSSKALHLVATEMLRLGDVEAANRLALASIKLLKKHPTILGGVRWTDEDMLHLVVTCAQQTSSTTHLREMLEALDPRLASFANFTSVHYTLLETLSRLRHKRRSSYNVEFLPGRSAYHYLALDISSTGGFVRQQMARLPAGPRLEFLKEQFPNYYISGVANSERELMLYVYLAPDLICTSFLSYSPLDSRYLLTLYDLTELKLMVRLHELVNSSAKTDWLAIAREGSLKDHYSGKPYLWHSATQQFYSVGPDGRDDQLLEYYTEQQVGRKNGSATGDLAIPLPALEETTETLSGGIMGAI